MNRDEVIQLLHEFESRRGGDPFLWRDVAFWPLIRPFLGMELHKSKPFEGLIKPPVSVWSRRAGVVRRLLMRFAAYRRWVRDLERQRGRPLLVTRTDRRRLSRGEPFHRMATPLRAFLTEMDLSLNVWEFDTPPYRDPRAIPTQGIVQWQWMFSPERQRRDPAPEWFAPLSDFLSRPPVAAPAPLREWPFWRSLMGSILFRADKYDQWLDRMKPRLIFVDCWYVSEVLPVIIAAHRQGIRTIDVQHGIQGKSHFGYAAWPDVRRSPLVPDWFWFWGRRDLDVFEAEDNLLHHAAQGLIGGSLELNHIREHLRSSERRQGGERDAPTVLVTEQKGIDISDVVVPAMRRTAQSHRWIIRPHPGQPDSALREHLGSMGETVEYISPGRETVDESLARADLHVTGFSSVALEALALGRMTMLVHPAGAEIYGEYLQKGLMKRADTTERLVEAITRPATISPKELEAGIREAFAPPEATRAALKVLLAESTSQ